jgi:hypothetical protein
LISNLNNTNCFITPCNRTSSIEITCVVLKSKLVLVNVFLLGRSLVLTQLVVVNVFLTGSISGPNPTLALNLFLIHYLYQNIYNLNSCSRVLKGHFAAELVHSGLS